MGGGRWEVASRTRLAAARPPSRVYEAAYRSGLPTCTKGNMMHASATGVDSRTGQYYHQAGELRAHASSSGGGAVGSGVVRERAAVRRRSAREQHPDDSIRLVYGVLLLARLCRVVSHLARCS